MPQRKKNQNKENSKIIKRTTLQQINYTQQMRIPTIATNEYLQFGHSIQLKKSNSKKPGSRKSRCISVKQYGAPKPIRFKQLLKHFNSLKLIQQKSKSPRSNSKSRPKTKKSSKKITQTNSRTNSSLNLTEKVERKINKLRRQKFFNDEDDSQIPLVSTSQAYTAQQQKKLQLVDNQLEQEINIKQMRLFCNQNESSFKKTIQMLKGNVYQIMARRIQRAWRRYRTHKLICRYAKMIVGFDISERSDHMSSTSSISDRRQDIIIQTEALYPQQMIQRKITHVSDLQKQQEIEIQRPQHKIIQKQTIQENDEQIVKDMKRQELKRLNQVINILGNKKINDPQERQRLLKQLMSQFQNDKKTIENNNKQQQNQHSEKYRKEQQIYQKYQKYQQKYQVEDQDNSESDDLPNSGPQRQDQYLSQNIRQIQQKSNKNNVHIPPLNIITKHHQHRSSSHSSDSMKQNQEQFNSKKYIEYLDSDMYPINSAKNSNKQQNVSPKICKQKQDILLSKLGSQNVKKINKNHMKVGIDDHFFQLQGQIRSRLSYRSNSQLSQDNSVLESQELSRRERNNPRNKQNQMRKSNSEKLLKIISARSPSQQYQQYTIQPPHAIEEQGKKHQQIKQQTHQESIKPAEIVQKIEQNKIIYQQSPQHNDLSDFVKRQIQDFDFQLNNNADPQKGLQEFDRLYSQQQLTRQLAQLKKLRDNDSDEDHQIYEDRGKIAQEQENVQPVLQRTNNQPFQLHRINIEDYDHNIQSDEQNNSGPDLAEKAQKISQMAFHSLLLELLKQMARYPDTIIKNFKAHTTQQSGTNRIVRAPSRQRKNGFATNQTEVKSFVQEICNYLLQDEPQVLKNLQKSTGPSALEMLRYMHQTQDDQIILDDQQDDPSVMVLPNWVFDNYWVKKSQNLNYERQNLIDERQRQRHEGLKSLNKIFFRSLFDCLNECLDFQRNFGPFGKPFPWKRVAAFQHLKTQIDTQKSIQRTKKRLLEVSSTYCGIIIQREEMLSICGNQEYLSQVQEDRLSRMLAQDLVEGQDRWIFYDDQQTELLVETSNFLYNQLIAEAIQELFMLGIMSL